MSHPTLKARRLLNRRHRTRLRLHGTGDRPRLVTNFSNRHVSAQLINDVTHQTLATSTSKSQSSLTTMQQKATWVGEDIAARAQAANIKQVVFDRGSRRYHGRVKLLAEAARAKGLEF